MWNLNKNSIKGFANSFHPIFKWITTDTTYLMFKRRNLFFFFCKCWLILNLLYSKKAGTGACYQCVTSPFLLAALKHLETEDNSCWSFVGAILSYCCSTHNFSASTVQESENIGFFFGGWRMTTPMISKNNSEMLTMLSLDSLNLLMILWAVGEEIPNFLANVGWLFCF